MVADLALLAATLPAGLIAGLFYAYSCSVMPGLGGVDDRALAGAMRSINTAILNGWFALSFAGAPLLTAVALALHLGDDRQAALPWLAAALGCCLATLAITARFNIPLNRELAATSDSSSPAELATARARFERPWARANHARTLTSAAAFACLTAALLVT